MGDIGPREHGDIRIPKNALVVGVVVVVIAAALVVGFLFGNRTQGPTEQSPVQPGGQGAQAPATDEAKSWLESELRDRDSVSNAKITEMTPQEAARDRTDAYGNTQRSSDHFKGEIASGSYDGKSDVHFYHVTGTGPNGVYDQDIMVYRDVRNPQSPYWNRMGF